jgi:F-type H+-transporting ATPase subunit delta
MASDSSQHTDSIERVYAQALLELARTEGRIDEVRDELNAIAGLLDSEPGLAKLIDSRVLRSESLAQSLKHLFAGKVSDVLYRFLQVLNAKGRLSSLPGVIRAFGQLVEAEHGVVEVQAFVAAELGEQQASLVASNIGKVLGKRVVLKQHVDPSLIGGLKLRVGDRLIDGSAATQLKILKERITEQGREKARGFIEQPA